MANEGQITPFNKVDELYQDYFNDLTKMKSEDAIFQSSCKFCNHPARYEAEQIYERTGNYSSVERFFSQYKENNPDSVDFSIQNVKNHLLNHYIQQQKQIWIKEYSTRLMSVMNKKISDEKRLDALRNMFEIKLIEIAANPTLDEFKKVDAMSKLQKSIIDIMMTSAQLKGDLKTVNVIEEKLTTVWFNMIDKQQNPEVKKILTETLESFQEKLDDQIGYTQDA